MSDASSPAAAAAATTPVASPTGSDEEHIAKKDALLQEHKDAITRREQAAAQQRELQQQAADAKRLARRQRRSGTPLAGEEGQEEHAAAVKIFTDAVKAAEEEWVKIAPEEEPFLHKYAAREMLLTAQTSLGELPQSDAIIDMIARLERRIGVNYVQTEENAAGSVALSRALNRLERRLHMLCAGLQDAGVATSVPQVLSATTVLATGIDVLDACNYKALLTSGWSNPLRAVLHLRKAQLAYDAVHRCLSACLPAGLHAFVTLPVSSRPLQQEGATYEALQQVQLSLSPGGAPLSAASLRVLAQRMRSAMVTLEALCTHTCFFRVQVLSQLAQGRAAAAAVEELLIRQLKYQLPFMVSGGAAAGSGGGSLDPTGDAPEQASWEEAPDVPAHIAQNLDMHAAGTGDVEPLNALEWSRHAMRLSDYYSNRGLYTHAAYCLTAADIMLGRETKRREALQTAAGVGAAATPPAPPSADGSAAAPPAPPAKPEEGPLLQEESFRQAKALSRMHWGMLHTAILKDARDSRLSAVLEHPLEDMPSEDVAEPLFTTDAMRALIEGKGPSVELPETALYNEGVLGALDASHRQLRMPTPPELPEDGVPPAVNVPSIANVGADIEVPEGAVLLRDGAGMVARGDGLLTAQAPFQDFITQNELEERSSAQAKEAGAAAGAKAEVTVRLPGDLKTFEDAREVFRLAHAALIQAQQFFVLNGFVTDHVAILTAQAACYKYISMYEGDLKRRQAMHARRVTLLGPMLDVLNPSIYFTHHKEISIECGHAAADMMDLRRSRVMARLEAEQAAGRPPAPKPAEVAAVNELAAKAIGFFHHFVRCYKDERLAESPPPAPPLHAVIHPSIGNLVGPGAAAQYDSGDYAATDVDEPLSGFTGIDEGSVHAYCTAHFHIVRLLQRRLMASVEQRVLDLTGSLRRAKWLLQAVPLLAGGDSDVFREELALLGEQVQLLPAQLDRLARAGHNITV